MSARHRDLYSRYSGLPTRLHYFVPPWASDQRQCLFQINLVHCQPLRLHGSSRPGPLNRPAGKHHTPYVAQDPNQCTYSIKAVMLSDPNHSREPAEWDAHSVSCANPRVSAARCRHSSRGSTNDKYPGNARLELSRPQVVAQSMLDSERERTETSEHAQTA